MASTRRAKRALFDVNVLIALLDAAHVHHARASSWLAANSETGWASCAVTQNGCVRIMSQPAYPGSIPAAEVADRLRLATTTKLHRFVASDISLLDPRRIDTAELLGHRQVTDAWLLGLAVKHDLRFVTFDSALPWRAVRNALPAHVVQL